jgi:hypothetical protein
VAQRESRYYRVAPRIWRHARDAHWSERLTLFALYLLTSPHRNMVGLYYLPVEYVQADLDWPRDEVESAIDTLERDGFAVYDPDARVMWIRNALAYDAPQNANQIKAAVRQLAELPRTQLLDDLAKSAAENCPALAQAIEARWPDPTRDTANPLSNRLANGLGNRLDTPSDNASANPSDNGSANGLANTVSVSVSVNRSRSRSRSRTRNPSLSGTGSVARAHEKAQRSPRPLDATRDLDEPLDEDQREAIATLEAIPGWPVNARLDAALVRDARRLARQRDAPDLRLAGVALELRQYLSDDPIKRGDHPRARYLRFVQTAAARRPPPEGVRGRPPTGSATSTAVATRTSRYPSAQELERLKEAHEHAEERVAQYAQEHLAHAARDSPGP